MASGLLIQVWEPDSSGQEMKVICRIVLFKQIGRILTCLTFLVCYGEALIAQGVAAPGTQASGSSLHLKSILGFQGISNNANGDVSIRDGYLRFQKNAKSFAQIPVSSIQGLSLGEQDRQVGGVPMMLIKSTSPYQGGRVISLFSHKKYETVTVEYVDPNGGFHGTIFQLNKGDGQVLRSELEAAGAPVAHIDDKPAKENTQETRNEAK